MGFEVQIDRERCKGCELCVHFCPRNILKMAAQLNAKGLHFAETQKELNCTGCTNCATICPDAAIEIFCHDEQLVRKEHGVHAINAKGKPTTWI